jgi:hypothetical protein
MTNPLRRAALHLGRFVLVAVLFSLACAQAPLFYSNQNQYLLHGLALAEHGQLDQDWLANTADPTPVFSGLICLTARLLPLEAIHVEYAVIFGVYGVSLLGLFDWLAGPVPRPGARLAYLALLLLVHAAFLRWLSYRVVGADYPYYLQGGLAGQYALGPVFQPSAFGVLLLASLVLFLKDHIWAATLVAGLGVVFHSTYLLAAGLLILGYLVVLLRERRMRLACGVALLALVWAVPVVLYVSLHFPPTSLEQFAEAQRILVHERIPHHCLPRLWCDGIALGQMLWMLLGIALTWRTRLFPILLILFLVSALLTVVQVITASDTLALLFPWRASVILVPLATALVLARLVLLVGHRVETQIAKALAGALILLLTGAGAWLMATGQGYQTTDEELPVMHWIRDHQAPGDVYLLPVQMPKLAASTRGSLSSDFKPLAQKRTDTRIIPVDLQRFRLVTGAPIYVDFKSVPYRDLDVLEWRRRMTHNQELLDGLNTSSRRDAFSALRAAGVNHVVLPRRQPTWHSEFTVYQDEAYRVLRVPPEP